MMDRFYDPMTYCVWVFGKVSQAFHKVRKPRVGAMEVEDTQGSRNRNAASWDKVRWSRQFIKRTTSFTVSIELG